MLIRSGKSFSLIISSRFFLQLALTCSSSTIKLKSKVCKMFKDDKWRHGKDVKWSHSVFLIKFEHISKFFTIFDSILSNIDEVLSINPSANVFLFGDFTIHHTDWLTYSGGTDQPGELCCNFLSQMTLLRWLTFPLWSQTVILIVLLFWIYLFLLTLVFVLQWLSLH